MQGSNSVSNDVIWARIKKKRKKKETGRRYQRVCFTKMLLEKLFFQMKKRLLWWWQWWGIHVEITRECRENYTYIYIYIWVLYIREILYLDTLFLDERDASVDCVIVLYDWKLIIYSLMPTRLLLLCLLC